MFNFRNFSLKKWILCKNKASIFWQNEFSNTLHRFNKGNFATLRGLQPSPGPNAGVRDSL